MRTEFDSSIDDMQFGYVQGKGTRDAIFMVRQFHEKYRAKGKRVFTIFDRNHRLSLKRYKTGPRLNVNRKL